MAGNNKSDFAYCRSCYRHLAGFIGVGITESLENTGGLVRDETGWEVTEKGWELLKRIGIMPENFMQKRSPLTRPCLDNTEKQPHLGGQLGAALLERLLYLGWLHRIPGERIIILTEKGSRELKEWLNIVL